MQEAGFLGTAAPRAADMTLLEMGMGAGLLAGTLLARANRYGWHAICQSAIVLVNFLPIGLMRVLFLPPAKYTIDELCNAACGVVWDSRQVK